MASHRGRDAPARLPAAARLRAQLDLDARPDVVDGHLAQDPLLAPRVAARPGLRVPGAFDAHEVAIRAVLGQQVSVRGATTLAARLVAAFGEPLDGATPPLGRLFPGAARLAGARVEEVRGLGMPEARARTIVELSRALAEGRVDLSAGADPERAVAALLALPGVGPWTAQYLAMRALRWPDAFPAGDLGVRRALGLDAVRDVEARARGWSPWRAYAVMHLWCE